MYLYKTAPFSWVLRNFDGIKDIAVRLQDNVPITLAEEDCLGLLNRPSGSLGRTLPTSFSWA